MKQASGADYDKARGGFFVSSGLSVSSGAEHLPDLDVCPISLVHKYRPQINKIFKEYKVLKRLGIREDATIKASDLLSVDDEVTRLQVKEERKRQAIEEAKRKAVK